MSKFLDQAYKKIETVLEKCTWENKHFYANYLAQTYYYVYHSVKLLECAIENFSEKDSFYSELFSKHVDEEQGHEKLALRDLNRLGYSVEDFPETGSTKKLWQMQYKWIREKDPIILMSYITILEYTATQRATWISKKSGSDAISFLKVHAEEDVDHVARAIDLINNLPEIRRDLVLRHFEKNAQLFIEFLYSCEISEKIAA